MLEGRRHRFRIANLWIAAPQPAGAEHPPDHAGDLQRRLLGLGELVEAGEHEALEAVRELESGEGGGVARIDASSMQEADQLLDIEGIAVGVLGRSRRRARMPSRSTSRRSDRQTAPRPPRSPWTSGR
jgi:hypothetical protein